jgi:hypothetical protein
MGLMTPPPPQPSPLKGEGVKALMNRGVWAWFPSSAWEPNFQAKLLLCLKRDKLRDHLSFAKQELGGQGRSQAGAWERAIHEPSAHPKP